MKLKPILHDGCWAFCAADAEKKIPESAIAMFREREGMTLIISEDEAARFGYKTLFHAAWIELSADTALDGTGVTATFSRILSNAGISCNVFAANYHDHIFVPFDRGKQAVQLLEEIEI